MWYPLYPIFVFLPGYAMLLKFMKFFVLTIFTTQAYANNKQKVAKFSGADNLALNAKSPENDGVSVAKADPTALAVKGKANFNKGGKGTIKDRKSKMSSSKSSSAKKVDVDPDGKIHSNDKNDEKEHKPEDDTIKHIVQEHLHMKFGSIVKDKELVSKFQSKTIPRISEASFQAMKKALKQQDFLQNRVKKTKKPVKDLKNRNKKGKKGHKRPTRGADFRKVHLAENNADRIQSIAKQVAHNVVSKMMARGEAESAHSSAVMDEVRNYDNINDNNNINNNNLFGQLIESVLNNADVLDDNAAVGERKGSSKGNDNKTKRVSKKHANAPKKTVVFGFNGPNAKANKGQNMTPPPTTTPPRSIAKQVGKKVDVNPGGPLFNGGNENDEKETSADDDSVKHIGREHLHMKYNMIVKDLDRVSKFQSKTIPRLVGGSLKNKKNKHQNMPHGGMGEDEYKHKVAHEVAKHIVSRLERANSNSNLAKDLDNLGRIKVDVSASKVISKDLGHKSTFQDSYNSDNDGEEEKGDRVIMDKQSEDSKASPEEEDLKIIDDDAPTAENEDNDADEEDDTLAADRVIQEEVRTQLIGIVNSQFGEDVDLKINYGENKGQENLDKPALNPENEPDSDAVLIDKIAEEEVKQVFGANENFPDDSERTKESPKFEDNFPTAMTTKLESYIASALKGQFGENTKININFEKVQNTPMIREPNVDKVLEQPIYNKNNEEKPDAEAVDAMKEKIESAVRKQFGDDSDIKVIFGKPELVDATNDDQIINAESVKANDNDQSQDTFGDKEIEIDEDQNVNAEPVKANHEEQSQETSDGKEDAETEMEDDGTFGSVVGQVLQAILGGDASVEMVQEEENKEEEKSLVDQNESSESSGAIQSVPEQPQINSDAVQEVSEVDENDEDDELPEMESMVAQVVQGLFGGTIDIKEENNDNNSQLTAERVEREPVERPKHKVVVSQQQPIGTRYADRFHPAKIVLDKMRVPEQDRVMVGQKRRWKMPFSVVLMGKGPMMKPVGSPGSVRIPFKGKVFKGNKQQ